MDKLQLDDFTRYHFLSGLKLAPDGSSAVYIDKISNTEENNYDSFLTLIRFPENSVRRLTTSGKESSFFYDDADTIVFPAKRSSADQPKDYHESTSFYRIRLSGGEAAFAFCLPYQVTRMEKISGHLYAFTASIDLNHPDPDQTDPKILRDYPDYHVLTELPYWANGEGFVSGIREALGLYDEETDHAEILTDPLFSVGTFSCTEDRIVFSGQSYDELKSPKSGIYKFDIAQKSLKAIIAPDELSVHAISCDKNGFYFLASDMARTGSNQSPDLYYYDGSVTKLCDTMPSVGPAPTVDVTLGGGSPFFVRKDTLYYRGLIRTDSRIFSFRDGKEVPETHFDGSVLAFDVCDDRIVFVGMKPGHLQEIYCEDRKSGDIAQITSCNEEILKDKYVGECRPVPFTDSDGVDIDGWIIYPKDYDETKRYPGILDMHGGPRAALGPYFFHEMQLFANEGYFVFFCNPRGSDGRGDAFADIRKKWGTVDYNDLMEFVDHVIDVTPALDPARLGVTGGSYGGWMTNWIIGHTHRFAAAASQRSFSNWLSDFGCSEIGYTFDVEEVGATPWEDPVTLWDKSPAKYADQVTTPTLFIHSLQDYNCPFSEGMQMFAGLKYHHVPSRVCAFEGENHELSRSGKPRHRIRRLEEILSWMDRYLKEET